MVFLNVVLIYIMLFTPNTLWTKRKPENYGKYAQRENKVLLAFERVGEVLVCARVLIFWISISGGQSGSYGLRPPFYACFYMKRTGFGISGATGQWRTSTAALPVSPWLALRFRCVHFSFWGSTANIFLLISTVLPGIGHIGIHIQHRNQILQKNQGTEAD